MQQKASESVEYSIQPKLHNRFCEADFLLEHNIDEIRAISMKTMSIGLLGLSYFSIVIRTSTGTYLLLLRVVRCSSQIVEPLFLQETLSFKKKVYSAGVY